MESTELAHDDTAEPCCQTSLPGHPTDLSEFPRTLYVVSPNGQQRCGGEYNIEDEMANGQPLWKQGGGRYWLYSGKNGMWIIGGLDAKEKNFACSRGPVFCKSIHDGMSPDMLLGAWHRMQGDAFTADSDISVTAFMSTPSCLRLVSPNHHEGCSGGYRLQWGLLINGMPVWKRKDGPCWLYSGSTGHWVVGDRTAAEQNFNNISRGSIHSKRLHGGVMPDKTAGGWRSLVDGRFQEDPAVVVAESPRTLYVVSPSGQMRCTGEYRPVPDTVVNGQPLWERMGGECWLYSGTGGLWIIGGRDAKDRGFQCTRGVICCKPPHQGMPPDRAKGPWLRLQGQAFHEDPSISVTTTPTSLHVVTPSGQQGCAGEYVLHPAHSFNGCPAWRQRVGRHRIFSSSSGAWVISTCLALDGGADGLCSLRSDRPHRGLTPDKLPGSWCWFDGEAFQKDPEIRIQAFRRRPPKLYVDSPRGRQGCSGEYALAPGALENGHPVWTQTGGRHRLYSGLGGLWVVGGSGAGDGDLVREGGLLCSGEPHGGRLPSEVAPWLRLGADESTFHEDPEVAVTTQPTRGPELADVAASARLSGPGEPA